MNNFKALVTEVRTQMDKDVQFLLDHGIDPSTKYSNIPLYDPEIDGLVILRGPSKDSPYFKDNPDRKIFPSDKVVIQSFGEYRDPYGNYYKKEYGEKEELSVNEFLKRIYNNPRNSETKDSLRLQDLDTADKINQANDEYIQARDIKNTQKEADFKQWVHQYESLFNLEGLSEKDQETALKKLYKANQEGYAVEDLSKLPIIWKIRNQKTLNIFANKIKEIENLELRKDLQVEFNQKQKEWFRQKLDNVATLLAADQWWKSLNDKKEESILTEINFPKPQNKPISIKDPFEVRNTLDKLGIDPRFTTVPIIKEPLYNKEKYKSAEEDPNAAALEKLVVVSFPDQSKLDDEYGLVRVKDLVSGNSYNMNIGELKNIIDKDVNQDSELDTVDFRLKDKQQFTSLNRGMGKFVDLPEEVIIEMLKTVNAENDDYEYVDLVKYYNQEKETGISNPLLTKALSEYNQGDTKQFVIRKFDTANGIKYKGFIPNSEHIYSKPAMSSKDPYKQLFK